MLQLGIIGHPLGHTLSPIIHDFLLTHYGLTGRYDVFDIELEKLEEGVKYLETIGCAGFNVTIPHKIAIQALLDEIRPAAQNTAAVNTVIRQDNRWIGDNTDVSGFLKSLPQLPNATSRVLILGAGGAARAVITAMTAYDPKRLALACRHPEKSTEAVETFKLDATLDCSDFDWIINCTPVGMLGHDVTACPLTAEQLKQLPGNTFVFDLIYRPLETPLLLQAKTRGLQTQHGLRMLIYQACEAFGLWTGKQVPESVIPELENLLLTALQ